jgi:hypothetical protein
MVIKRKFKNEVVGNIPYGEQQVKTKPINQIQWTNPDNLILVQLLTQILEEVKSINKNIRKH